MFGRICFAGMVLACSLLAVGALAQSTGQNISKNSRKPNKIEHSTLLNSDQKPVTGEQKIQHIRIEDAGSRIDELRVGSETQSIDVQPKANVPAYQVTPPAGGSAGLAQRDSPPSAQGVRTWKIFSF